MPTLTVAVDLTDEAYRNALSLPPDEQNRVASIALTAVFATAWNGLATPALTTLSPEQLSQRLTQDAEASSSFYLGLTDLEKAERLRIIEEGSLAGDAGRIADSDTMFARIRARHNPKTGSLQSES